jgi:hypothetical protein
VDEEPMTVSREEDKPKVSSSSPMRCSLLAFGGIGKEFMNFDAFRVRFDVVVVVVWVGCERDLGVVMLRQLG